MSRTISSKESAFSLMPQEEYLETKSSHKKISIGIPKEKDSTEKRIPLTPYNIALLKESGIDVKIEKGAGLGAAFTDLELSESGAEIVNDKAEIYQSDIILKIAPPDNEEIQLLANNRMLISTLNLKTLNKKYFNQLAEKKITALAYELIKDKMGMFPIVRSMSEIAGSSCVNIAATLLSNSKGKMIGGIVGVKPSEIVILGAGTVAESAAQTALGLGASVKIFDKSVYRLRRLQNNLGRKVFTSILQTKLLESELLTADIVIGALKDTHKSTIIGEEIIKKMKKGSVLLDVSIDQGGCFETSKITNIDKPTFTKYGIIHYCVPNIPSIVPRTASYALGNIFCQEFYKLYDYNNINHFFKNDEGFRSGIYLYKGILINQEIGNKFNIPTKDINLILAAF